MLLRALAGRIEALGLARRSLVVAVSGGVDSVALLAALHELAQQYGLKLSVVHVNHGLRGSESEADEVFVRELAGSLGLACAVLRVAPGELREGGPSRERPTLQEAARGLRHAAFERVARSAQADHVVTAHQLDDQAETVLLRLFRGSGPDGLAGIPERSPDGLVVRPLLGVPRAEIERFARARRLTWREDASNRSPEYRRSHARELMPELARRFNPQILRAIGDLAEALRRDGEWIRAAVDDEVRARFAGEGEALAIDAKDWTDLPPALARRVAREALARCGAGRDAARVHLERMCAFLGTATRGKRIELPGGLVLERRRSDFRLGRSAASSPRDAC